MHYRIFIIVIYQDEELELIDSVEFKKWPT